MPHTSDISVLIVAYRSRDTIGRCLDALAAQTVKPREVLLLENGSPAAERVSVSDVPDWVHMVESDENLGFAGGNNRLARLATGRWLALLNPDAYARPDWIEQLCEATGRYPGIALFGSTQYSAERPDLLDGAGDVYHATGLAYRAGYLRPASMLPPEGEVFGPCAAAALIRKDVFDMLDGFDERFFCYNEDVDLAYRARLLGHRAIQLSGAAVDHAGYASSGRRSEFATYYGVRNREWVFFKNTPGWLLAVLSPLHVATVLALWLSAARFGQFTLFGRALRDAWAAWPEMARSRRLLQQSARIPPSRIAAAMAWNPLRLLSRSPDIRPYPDGQASTREARAR
ncbi:glycosyltransferase family 2 protein [Maricaulis sp.]|uniref:glycosyltransferase family 2 protein n=1 Tax=Maricaulis sp. TaxID=1486257 RepID=UPI002610D4B7|nr:glycosyltransferase family 2 protein [Maricaulis sp.]